MSIYQHWLDHTAGSVNQPDESEHKCWECGCMFTVDQIVNGGKWWRNIPGSTFDLPDFIPLCVPCYEEFERIDAELEAEEEKQLDAAIYNDVIKTMRK